MEDEKIIELYWNRDQGAIRHTAEKYGSYCGRIAKNILLNKEDCEECVNDTWMRAWNAMPDERPAILSAFLGAIRFSSGQSFTFASATSCWSSFSSL